MGIGRPKPMKTLYIGGKKGISYPQKKLVKKLFTPCTKMPVPFRYLHTRQTASHLTRNIITPNGIV
jgi:hypothetical protein